MCNSIFLVLFLIELPEVPYIAATISKSTCYESSDPYVFKVEKYAKVEVPISEDHLRRVCSGMEVNFVDEPGFVQAVSNLSRWSRWLGVVELNKVPSSTQIEECISFERRRSESMAIGRAKKVAVIGGIRRRKVVNASKCSELSVEAVNLGKYGQCAESAFVAFNRAGVAYFHTMYDTLGTLAFGLDEIYATRSKVVMNTCIDAHDLHLLERGKRRSEICVHHSYVRQLLLAAGITSEQIIEYPFQDPKLDTLFLGEAYAVIDTSMQSSKRGDYFKPIEFESRSLSVVHKLQESFFRHLRITEEEITPIVPYILLVDRNDSSLSWHKIANPNDDSNFDEARIVGNIRDIATALKVAFPEYRIIIHAPPYGTVREQAILYGSAAAIIGPHGAAESNYIFCRRQVPVLEILPILNPEYISSPLYIGVARDLGLFYWTVPVFTLRVVDPNIVVKTLRAAILHMPGTDRSSAIRSAPATAVITLTSKMFLR